MKLQKLEIENLGEITSFSFDFQKEIVVFPIVDVGAIGDRPSEKRITNRFLAVTRC